MALGIPVIATSDAVYGMDMVDGEGIYIIDDDTRMAAKTSELLGSSEMLSSASKKARAFVERHYSFEASYGKLAAEVVEYLDRRTGAASES